ncbi:uncharacterized [Tachysurus ichikawai]
MEVELVEIAAMGDHFGVRYRNGKSSSGSEPGVNGTWIDWFSCWEFEQHGYVMVNERLIKIQSAEERAPRFLSGLSEAPLDCGPSSTDDLRDSSTLEMQKWRSDTLFHCYC